MARPSLFRLPEFEAYLQRTNRSKQTIRAAIRVVGRMIDRLGELPDADSVMLAAHYANTAYNDIVHPRTAWNAYAQSMLEIGVELPTVDVVLKPRSLSGGQERQSNVIMLLQTTMDFSIDELSSITVDQFRVKRSDDCPGDLLLVYCMDRAALLHDYAKTTGAIELLERFSTAYGEDLRPFYICGDDGGSKPSREEIIDVLFCNRADVRANGPIKSAVVAGLDAALFDETRASWRYRSGKNEERFALFERDALSTRSNPSERKPAIPKLILR